MGFERCTDVVRKSALCLPVCCAAVGVAFCLFIIVLLSSIKVVEINQQLVFRNSTDKWAQDGPFTAVIWPHQRMERREAQRLGPRDFAVLVNERTGERRHLPGPGLIFPDAYESHVETKPKVVLQKNEYMRLVDTLSGFERVVRGPMTLVPEPLEEAPNGTEQVVIVGATNSVLTLNKTTGLMLLHREEGMFVPEPYEKILEVKEARLIEESQFAVVKDELSGHLRHELGPQLLCIGAYDRLLEVQDKIVLEKDEYLRLLEQRTGAERVLVGPQTVVPEPTEEIDEGKQVAAFLTTDTAALVLDRTTGQQNLQTSLGVFVPGPYKRILEVRQKIRVLPHAAVIVRDAEGRTEVRTGAGGTGAEGAFFLEPYTKLVEMSWSSYSEAGAREPVPKVPVTMIDLRARKMFFNYEVRTGDNVKLTLEGTIFWQVKDVAAMISMTSDPSGDISQHARSALIQGVSKVTLSAFMSDFNNITEAAFATQASDGFYAERGVEVQSMELTRFDCVDPETASVLQQIIQETTNRINQLQIAESQNEVRSAKLRADIELERQRTDLIRTQSENAHLQAEMEGQAEGTKLVESVATFIDGLNTSLPDVTSRVDLYRLHEVTKGRNTDTKNLADGTAHLFLTPQDLDLRLNMDGSSSS
jgi:regulator of protease activity HflC (stomatin/prohibitin superfamily)